ncbi:hypothetical protein FRC05_002108 [Tulasnella sp. 425]|nr:hypothetical protein FRC05_002108 [Tulasnella sp. 425]
MISRRLYLLRPHAINATAVGSHNHSHPADLLGTTLRESTGEGTRLATARVTTPLSSRMKTMFWNGHLVISIAPGTDHHLHRTNKLPQGPNTNIRFGEPNIDVGVAVRAPVRMKTIKNLYNVAITRQNEDLTKPVFRETFDALAVQPPPMGCGPSRRVRRRKVEVGVGVLEPSIVDVPGVMNLATRAQRSPIFLGGVDDPPRAPLCREIEMTWSTSANIEEGSADMEHNDASIASLSIKGASKSTAASAYTPVLGFSIKGQAARMGLTEMKSLGENRTRGDQAQESVRDVNLPSLLARMTDSTRPRDGGTDAEAIAPFVADIMARTRHQLSIKHKGKAKAVDSDVNLNVVAEPSLHQTDAIYDGEQPSLDAGRRRQLMAKLAEERKKFLQSESSRPTNVVSEPNEALEPDRTLRDNGLNADEQRLRAQARLRVKLGSERRMVSVPVTQQTPSNSSPMSTTLSPVETSLTPVMPTPTSESLLSLEDGLKVKLKQRQTGVSMEQDLKERLRKRKQSLV